MLNNNIKSSCINYYTINNIDKLLNDHECPLKTSSPNCGRTRQHIHIHTHITIVCVDCQNSHSRETARVCGLLIVC